MFHAVGRKDGISLREVNEMHGAAAEHERQPVLVGIVERRNPEFTRRPEGVLYANEIKHLDGGNVHGLRKRIAYGKRPANVPSKSCGWKQAVFVLVKSGTAGQDWLVLNSVGTSKRTVSGVYPISKPVR